MDNTPIIAERPSETWSETWSEVRAHARVMRYRRIGAGPPVVLLGFGAAADERWPELIETLASRFRIIVPDVPPDIGAARWMEEFLEGLGTADVAVVAINGSCIPALELGLRDSHQIARLVLIPDGKAHDVIGDGTLTTDARNAALPLLVVRRGPASADTVSAVSRFLGSD